MNIVNNLRKLAVEIISLQSQKLGKSPKPFKTELFVEEKDGEKVIPVTVYLTSDLQIDNVLDSNNVVLTDDLTEGQLDSLRSKAIDHNNELKEFEKSKEEAEKEDAWESKKLNRS